MTFTFPKKIADAMRHEGQVVRLQAWGKGMPVRGPKKFKVCRDIVDYFLEHEQMKLPDLTRPTNIGYTKANTLLRAIVLRAYKPWLFWVRVETNTQHEKHTMNPVRRSDVPRVLVALGFSEDVSETRWTTSGAGHTFGMPPEWRTRWTTMGGSGHERIYFARFGQTVKVLSPMLFHREFKRENRIPGLNEYLGSLPYTEKRFLTVQNELTTWLTEDKHIYKMEKPLLKLIGSWCSRQVLKDLGLETK